MNLVEKTDNQIYAVMYMEKVKLKLEKEKFYQVIRNSI